MNKLWRQLPIEWRIMLNEYGPLLLAAVMFCGLAGAYFVFNKPDPHKHVRFIAVDVLSTFDQTTDAGFSVGAHVRFPDGTEKPIHANSLAAAQWFVSDTCIEERLTESGRSLYRLVAPINCLS